ncbi:MAG: IS4 family transposase [Gammaproteobacteria bacterium]|nr:IS4 family transposase [Gammaproteobacteria bacterium]
MHLFGRTFTGAIIARIQAAAAEPGVTRSSLSRQVCGWLEWFGADGRAQEVSCRKALVELERRALVALPAARRAAPQARPVAVLEPFEAPVFSGPLEALGPIELVAVEDREHALLYRRMLTSYHPLGGGPLCGAQQRYLIRSPVVGWLGALAFSAAAWQLAARDDWIGWCAHARRANLNRVVANSRFLILPSIAVPNLGSHVLGLAAARVQADWPVRYGITPLVLETFVDEAQHAGTVYKAANWQRLGETSGRGRQDRANTGGRGHKAVYVLTLTRDWRAPLCRRPAPVLRPAPPAAPTDSWAEQEFGRVDFPDARLRPRLIQLAEAFGAHPTATLATALNGAPHQVKAAYRFFHNPQVDLQTLLHPHYEATAARIRAQPLVLVAQDTTSLNYDAHAATTGLGPINTRRDGARGLKLHDSLALTPEGIPLGLIDIQVWARDPQQTGQAKARKARPIAEKESHRWLKSFQRTAEVQALCPQTRLVNIADREADIYELFQAASADPAGTHLLVRASRTTQRQVDAEDEIQPLWELLPRQPVLGGCVLHIPGRGGRPARTAALELRAVPIDLQPPKRLKGATPLRLWAIDAREINPPDDQESIEWLLLTTVPTTTLEEALERLCWYAARWNIEVFHRTLKSGCRIEDRRLGDADSLQACLAIDLVVAWRVMDLAKRGRETPDIPCTVFFEEAEWQALACHHQRSPTPPQTPPSLGEAMRMVARLGGFLGRNGDGDPGATALWRGLNRLTDITETFAIFYPSIPAGP